MSVHALHSPTTVQINLSRSKCHVTILLICPIMCRTLLCTVSPEGDLICLVHIRFNHTVRLQIMAPYRKHRRRTGPFFFQWEIRMPENNSFSLCNLLGGPLILLLGPLVLGSENKDIFRVIARQVWVMMDGWAKIIGLTSIGTKQVSSHSAAATLLIVATSNPRSHNQTHMEERVKANQCSTVNSGLSLHWNMKNSCRNSFVFICRTKCDSSAIKRWHNSYHLIDFLSQYFSPHQLDPQNKYY